ncbi:MAG: hypothetical protein WD227_09105, partial [Vicinamibacterales bacterium]
SERRPDLAAETERRRGENHRPDDPVRQGDAARWSTGTSKARTIPLTKMQERINRVNARSRGGAGRHF